VELNEAERLPAQVDVPRPPTFERARGALRERRGHYHLLGRDQD